MTISTEDIKRQLQLGEDSAWEFKQIEFSGNRPVGPRRDELADEIAAFANTDGGVLLCGVTGAGEVQGMSREQMDELDRLVVEICTDAIKPSIRPAILRRQLGDDKPFLLVSVPQGHAQHDSPGGSYHRVGSSKRRMTSDERLRLAQRRGQARFLWFDKQTVPDTGFRTLEEELWKPLLSAEGAADPRQGWKKWDCWPGMRTVPAGPPWLACCCAVGPPRSGCPMPALPPPAIEAKTVPRGKSTPRPSAGR